MEVAKCFMAMIACIFVNQPELKCWEWTDDFYMTAGSIADYQVGSHTESVGSSPRVDCRDALPVASPCLAIKNDVEPNIEEHQTMERTDSHITQG
uniref:Uncharacterized protein n=1 Tax=Populus trichocarpa TaxID=3694 RepID=A0A2K1Z8H2_POPTR